MALVCVQTARQSRKVSLVPKFLSFFLLTLLSLCSLPFEFTVISCLVEVRIKENRQFDLSRNMVTLGEPGVGL